jgi:glycosyltransferase involved in cell wall biosynthesis
MVGGPFRATGGPRICVVIPVFNHGLTVQSVVRGAKAVLPVIVVNDGSTDATTAALAAETGITMVTLPRNLGKASALRAGFASAEELGFTHAITIDADGQHSTSGLADFASACRRQPEALIIGVRDFKKAGAPLVRRMTNELSTFWFKFETGLPLADTQCGYRCYPMAALRPLRVTSGRYAYELELLVKAAWAGVPLVAQAVEADYAAPTSRLSHFRPWRDMMEMSWLHLTLSLQALFVPAVGRKEL